MSETNTDKREEVVVLGAVPQGLTDQLHARYVVHPIHAAADPLAELAAVGAECRAAVDTAWPG